MTDPPEPAAPDETINIVQMADKVGIKEATVRKYASEFSIPSFKRPSGERHFSAALVPVFRQIKALREGGMGAEEIRSNIAETLAQEAEKLAVLPEAQGVDVELIVDRVAERMRGEIQKHDQALLRSLIEERDREAGALREELGRAKALIEIAQAQLGEAQQQARLLPEKAQSLEAAERKAWQAEQIAERAHEREQAAGAEALKLAGELEQARDQIRALEAEAKVSAGQITDLQAQAAAQAGQIRELQQLLQAEREALARERGRSWWAKLTQKT